MCHPVCRRPTHRGAGQGQGDKVERPTGRTALSPGPGLLGSAWVGGWRDGIPPPTNRTLRQLHLGVVWPPPEAKLLSAGAPADAGACAASRPSASGAARLRAALMTLDVYAGLFGDDLDQVAHRLDEAFAARDADHSRTGAANGTVVDLGKQRSPGR